MDKNIYIVACNAAPTSLVLANSTEEAIRITKKQANKDMGDCDNNWIAYEINEYFSDDCYDPYFFGWIINADCNYLS